MNILKFIVVLTLSFTLFSFLFYKIDYKFENIRNKINNLNEKQRRKVKRISFFAVIGILLILERVQYEIFGINDICTMINYIAMGVLISFRETCFKNTLIENKF